MGGPPVRSDTRRGEVSAWLDQASGEPSGPGRKKARATSTDPVTSQAIYHGLAETMDAGSDPVSADPERGNTKPRGDGG